MIEIQKFQELADTLAISGCEKKLAEKTAAALSPFCKEVGVDAMNSVIAKKGEGKKKIAVFAPLDTSGLLCVPDTAGKTKFLPVGTFDAQEAVGREIVLVNGEAFLLRSEKEKNAAVRDLYIETVAPRQGAPAKLKSKFQKTGDTVCGQYASSYALYLLLEEAAKKTVESANETIFVFTAQSFFPRALSEYNAAMRENPDLALALGSAESESEAVLIGVRDGKHFSDPNLILQAEKAAEEAGIPFDRSVPGKKITKAEEIAATGIPVLSLFLPCRNQNKANESVSEKAVENLQNILERILQI